MATTIRKWIFRSQFKGRCLELIREVESGGEPVLIKRRGNVVARLIPPRFTENRLKPWENLRAMGGNLRSEPGESVLRDEDIAAMR